MGIRDHCNHDSYTGDQGSLVTVKHMTSTWMWVTTWTSNMGIRDHCNRESYHIYLDVGDDMDF